MTELRLLMPSHDKNIWDCGYFHSNNGIVIIDGDELRFKFKVKEGDIYSFWISKSKSGGYLGAGGIGKKTYIDEDNK